MDELTRACEKDDWLVCAFGRWWLRQDKERSPWWFWTVWQSAGSLVSLLCWSSFGNSYPRAIREEQKRLDWLLSACSFLRSTRDHLCSIERLQSLFCQWELLDPWMLSVWPILWRAQFSPKSTIVSTILLECHFSVHIRIFTISWLLRSSSERGLLTPSKVEGCCIGHVYSQINS